MRHSTLRQIVMETNTYARPLAAAPDAQLAAYDFALTTIRLALEGDEQPRAWERVAVTLADRRMRLPVDALDALPVEQARRRLALLAETPSITGFESYQDIVALIGETIRVGASRYNSGDIRGCAALYWLVVRLICETPATRGFPGYARLQGQLKPLADTEAHAGTMSLADADVWAWELRHAFDATLRAATV
ncbi:MAG TPA: hypothetical protein VFQ25_09735 [Ktedonobacterales bacterium]|nr:hypothetical protein [Ktedonobacterales bacterium]